MLDPQREYGTGWAQWNPQAVLDWLVAGFVLGRLEDVVPKTYVPILRLVSRTADNLRHVQALHETFPHVAATARQAVRLIYRDPVVWS